jgi:dipeptidyl aminopeptidase/acylaminoacyl peptidase
MMKNIRFFTILFFMTTALLQSQENIVYQTPPQEILELVDIDRAPIVRIDSKGEQMLFYYRSTFKSLSDLNQPEIRLGGLRVNPVSNISSTITYYNDIRYKKTTDTELKQVEGLPVDARIAYASFSPDETKIAFANATDEGVELWIADLDTLKARRLTSAVLNANVGFPYGWLRDGSGLLTAVVPFNRAPLIDTGKAIPEGPVVSVSDGHTADGQFPFIDELDLRTLEKRRIFQSTATDHLEEIVSFIDSKQGSLITRVESPSDFPNFYIRNLRKRIANTPLTSFENPFKSIEGVHKEVINYKREDGVELTGTLYLPVGYDKEKKEKLPMIMWAYPREYKDLASAGQSSNNPNAFTYLSYGNPVYWVTRGYVVLDEASFPIVGEGDEQPNDTFVEQLVSNAKAAIDAVDALGYIDRERVAVGGHSYGAFMTANLLSHSNLFAAGIARSGAYNRTLTPFGFQAEERNYWDAPDVYDVMSPFMHANKMKTPMLLIHGEADNNSGTHTMQSERYFQALKSFGAPARLVILPMESHGYVAKENVLHLLWEQDQWLDKYVKNKSSQHEK